MKKTMFFTSLTLLIGLSLCSCSKDNNEQDDCKTCRALPSGERPLKTQQVCTGQEMEAFYAAHPQQEITCN